MNRNPSPTRRGQPARAGPPAPRSWRPHIRRPSRQSTGRSAAAAYQWRLAASSGTALQRLPQSEHHPAVGYVESAVAPGSPQRRHSREKPAESANWGEERKGGALTVAAGSAPDPGEGRSPLCFAVDCCASES